MPRKLRLHRTGLRGLDVILLVGLLLWAGCYHWVPIEPNFANGEQRTLDEVRIGGEGGNVLLGASIKWPLLTKGTGQPLTLDLRQTPAERKTISKGATAGAIICAVLGVSFISAIVVVAIEFSGVGWGTNS